MPFVSESSRRRNLSWTLPLKPKDLFFLPCGHQENSKITLRSCGWIWREKPFSQNDGTPDQELSSPLKGSTKRSATRFSFASCNQRKFVHPQNAFPQPRSFILFYFFTLAISKIKRTRTIRILTRHAQDC